MARGRCLDKDGARLRIPLYCSACKVKLSITTPWNNGPIVRTYQPAEGKCCIFENVVNEMKIRFSHIIQ
jgi:hypothetical protein